MNDASRATGHDHPRHHHQPRRAADLSRGVRDGDRRAVARLISLVENGEPEALEALQELFPLTGRAMTIGVTGAPGAGKSTLVDGLIRCMRGEGLTVGVIAVDPTSPFSRGAFLGDRTRMSGHTPDPGVYIRSMASRGHLGGLSLAVPEAMRILEAAGYGVVIAETVGVGQSEVEVAKHADTTVVVVAPGMGDSIQAYKAGILEVADVLCVNKCDRPGADDTARDMRELAKLGGGRDRGWHPPVVKTTAETDEGVADLWEAVRRHHDHLVETGGLESRRRDRIAAEIEEIAIERMRAAVLRAAGADLLTRLTDEVLRRELDPYTAADAVLRELGVPDDG